MIIQETEKSKLEQEKKLTLSQLVANANAVEPEFMQEQKEKSNILQKEKLLFAEKKGTTEKGPSLRFWTKFENAAEKHEKKINDKRREQEKNNGRKPSTFEKAFEKKLQEKSEELLQHKIEMIKKIGLPKKISNDMVRDRKTRDACVLNVKFYHDDRIFKEMNASEEKIAAIKEDLKKDLTAIKKAREEFLKMTILQR